MLMNLKMMILMMILMTMMFSSPFFCPIDLVVSTQLAIRGKLKNGPLDGIDINCHSGHGGSCDVEETVLQVLESSIGRVFNQFHWPRHKTCGVSV